MITDYQFGSVTVNGQTYRADLVIFPNEVRPNWWRKEGHALHLEDLAGIFDKNLDAVVIGTGAYGVMKVSKEVTEAAKEKNVRLIIKKTGEACGEYNSLVQAGKRTVAALHLTC
ncbi:MAG: MTH938/NDUFAF3 family protein [Pseudomonadota bacterium]